MNAPLTDLRPNVRISDDMDGFDHCLSRLVDKMLQALAVDYMASADFKCVAQRTRGSARNPLSQKRLFRRLNKAYGRTLLASDLITGKGHFKALFDGWIPITADDNDEAKAPLAWLAGLRSTFNVKKLAQKRDVDDPRQLRFSVTTVEPKKPVKEHTRESPTQRVTVISRHALNRLVQRADCRTPEDLIAILRKAWPIILLAHHASDGGQHYPEGNEPGWVIPTQLTPTSPIAYLVLRKYDFDPAWQTCSFIATVLSGDMIVAPGAFNKLNKLLAENPVSNPFEIMDRDPAPLLDAFRKTVMSTRAGQRGWVEGDYIPPRFMVRPEDIELDPMDDES